jgi:flagellar biogenesis protein FliO
LNNKNKYKLTLFLSLFITAFAYFSMTAYASPMEILTNTDTTRALNQSPDHNPSKEKTVVSNGAEYNQNLSEIYKHKKNIEKVKEPPKPPSIGKMFFSMSIVLLLIYVVALIYSKIKGVNPNMVLAGKFHQKNMDAFNVLSTASLGQGKNIHLVEINGKKIVIGSTLNNISLLTELDNNQRSGLPELQDEIENAETETELTYYKNLYKDYLPKE